MAYRKATPAERAEYDARTPRPVYPLAGFVKQSTTDPTQGPDHAE